MINLSTFINARLHGGFVIERIEISHEPLLDALGRDAAAQTRIIGRQFSLHVIANLSEEELSVTLYHEVLEAATVASLNPPASVLDLNEAGFEAAAIQAHQRWGSASPGNLDWMLQFYDFREEFR